MPYNGSGVYSLPAPEYPGVPGTIILAEDRNVIDSDISDALNLGMTRDGQTTWTGNVNFGGFSISGLLSANTFTVPNLPPTTSDSSVVNAAFVQSVAFSAALPAISAATYGQAITNNGTTAFWSRIVPDFLLQAQGVI